jgi:hypothetical protein
VCVTLVNPAGAFTAGEGKPLVSPTDLPNCNMRLYGGAQFHRAMTEFRLGVGGMACPTVTREEIVNACGLDDIHDGEYASWCPPARRHLQHAQD